MISPAPSVPLAPDAIPGVWRGYRARALAPTETTGSKSLDEALQGGWPQGNLTEIVSRYRGFGFSLTIPTLARLTQAGKYVALVSTPYDPYAPGLDSRGVDLRRLLWIQPKTEVETLWTVEQLILSGLVAAVVFWTKSELDGNSERRLQLAAETSRCTVLLFRSGSIEGPSYAALKIAAAPAADGEIAVDVLKVRGGRAGRRITQSLASLRSGRPSA